MNPQELLSQSQSIKIILPPEKQDKDARTARFLMCALENMGKDVVLEDEIASQRPSPFSQIPQLITEQKERTFIVSIKKLAPWISKISYEKDDQDLNIYFTLKQEHTPAHLSAPQLNLPAQLTIAVGTTYQGLKETSLIHATDTLKSTILETLSQSRQSWVRLLAAILSTLEYLEEHHLYISHVSHDSVRASQAQPKDLQYVIEEVRRCFGDHSSYLALTEKSPASTQGLLWSPIRETQDKLMLYGNGEGKGNWVLFTIPTKPFSQLKEEIAHTLHSPLKNLL